MTVDVGNSDICSGLAVSKFRDHAMLTILHANIQKSFLEDALSLKISIECRCNFDQDDFHDSSIDCKGNGELVYMATMEYSTDDGSELSLIHI